MHQDLRKLIDDPRFLRYHAEVAQPRRFNPFDVLRYADYEIRHSNVLAWLLQPNETHGIGDAFIRAFTTALSEEAQPPRGVGAATVRPAEEGGRICRSDRGLTDADLSATPMSEIRDATLRQVECFLDEDYSRIETCLKCMAFEPAAPAP